MNNERNLGVTEARLGLSLLICLLLAVGYMILHQLGGTGQALPVEIRSGIVTGAAAERDETATGDDEQPQVLTIESGNTTTNVPRTSQRPDEPEVDDGNFDR